MAVSSRGARVRSPSTHSQAHLNFCASLQGRPPTLALSGFFLIYRCTHRAQIPASLDRNLGGLWRGTCAEERRLTCRSEPPDSSYGRELHHHRSRAFQVHARRWSACLGICANGGALRDRSESDLADVGSQSRRAAATGMRWRLVARVCQRNAIAGNELPLAHGLSIGFHDFTRSATLHATDIGSDQPIHRHRFHSREEVGELLD